jgi:hypothetical protein
MPDLNVHFVFNVCKLLTVIGLCSSPFAWADVELIPFTGHRSSGEFEDIATGARIDVDDTSSYGLIINIDDEPGTAYEYVYSKQSSQLRSGATVPGTVIFDIDIEYLHMGGILLEPINSRAQSFFGAGIGITHFSPGLSGFSSESKLSFSLTGGIKHSLNKQLGIQLGLRAYATTVSSNTAIFCRNGSCSVRFSGDLFTQFEANAGLIFRF